RVLQVCRNVDDGIRIERVEPFVLNEQHRVVARGEFFCERRLPRRHLPAEEKQFSLHENLRLISANGMAAASPLNVPCCAISVAALRKPLHAARASAPPTLMRRTPSVVRSATVAKSAPTNTFTGFGATAFTTAAMS